MSQHILIEKLSVRAANALANSLVYGFPAVTAFCGFGHALQRRLSRDANSCNLTVNGVGVICHQFEMLDHQEGYRRRLQLTANPLKPNGERPSIVEEGRCHMTVSLILEIEGGSIGNRDCQRISEIVCSMKLAGGDIISPPTVSMCQDDRSTLRGMMPGYALMERRDLMTAGIKNGDDALDAVHNALAIHHHFEEDDSKSGGKWIYSRRQPGWIVPIATGFKALTPLGSAANTRDNSTPHRFAESVTTLGQFILASRIRQLSDLIWRYQIQDDFYLCQQKTLQSTDNDSFLNPQN